MSCSAATTDKISLSQLLISSNNSAPLGNYSEHDIIKGNMFTKFAAAAILVLTSSAACAAQPNSFYAGVDTGRTKIADLGGNGGSAGLFVGYNIHPNVAIEAGYRYLVGIEFDGPGIHGDVDVYQASLGLVGSVPLSGRFNLLGRLGYSRVKAESDDLTVRGIDDSRAVIGVGVSYAFSPAISGRVELQKPSGNTKNLSVGVAYTF